MLNERKDTKKNRFFCYLTLLSTCVVQKKVVSLHQNYTVMKKILCILVLAIFTAVSANAQQQRVNLIADPATSDFVPSVQGAEIQFEQLAHEFGDIVQNANGDIDFRFKNIGSEPLVLFDVRQSCATCVTIRSFTREPVMPGQEGVIALRYNTQLLGPRASTITILSNARSDRVVLRVNGNVTSR